MKWFQAAGLILLASTAAIAADFSQLAENAQGAFQAVGEAEVEAARAELAERVVIAERLLNLPSAGGQAWAEYLRWDGLQKQLTPGAKVDIKAALQTRAKLGSGAEGLERSALQSVAEAIDRYVGVATFAAAPADRQQVAYQQAVDRLTQTIADEQRFLSARGSYAAEQAFTRAAGLESLGYGVGLLNAVRVDYGGANLKVDIQSELLNEAVGRPVSRVAPVTDCILGTSIRGTGDTTGLLRVRPIASARQARLRFEFAGVTQSHTVGSNGPARITSAGHTTFAASTTVVLSDDAFAVQPTQASATTKTRTLGVRKAGGGIGSRIVESIARKRVAQQKSRADAIASSHAGERVARQLGDELGARIAKARGQYEERFVRGMRRRLASPRSLGLSTTDDALEFQAVFASEDQFAAPEDAAPEPAAAPLSARVHQTAVNNLLGAILGGATIRRDAVEQPPKLDIVAPPWLKLKAEPPAEGETFKPWAMTLRAERPISVEFGEGEVTLMLHAAELRAEDKAYRGWDLIARYRPVASEAGWRLRREGGIEVLPTRFDPTAGRKLSGSEVGLRNNLAKVLNGPPARFPETIDVSKIDLSKRDGPFDQLTTIDLQVAGGWLVAGLEAD